jgi:hypothetical protein
MANFCDFSDPKNLNKFWTVAGAQWWYEKQKSSSSKLTGHIIEKQTRSDLKTSVLSVNLMKNIYRKTCCTVKYHCDFTYVNHKKSSFRALHCGPISLHEILPDMDKQDSIGEMRSSASKLTVTFSTKGTREKSCGRQHTHLSLFIPQKRLE